MYIRLVHLHSRQVTGNKTDINTVGNRNRHIHYKNVRTRLRVVGLQAHRPYLWLPLTRVRRARRMAWLVAHAPR